jgi:hypothetical protein
LFSFCSSTTSTSSSASSISSSSIESSVVVIVILFFYCSFSSSFFPLTLIPLFSSPFVVLFWLLLVSSPLSCGLSLLCSFPVPVLFVVVMVVGLKSTIQLVSGCRLVCYTLPHFCFLLGDFTKILLCIPASIRSKFPWIDVMIDSVDSALLLLFFGFFFPGLVVVHSSSSVSVCVFVLYVVFVRLLKNFVSPSFYLGISLRLKLEVVPVERLSIMLSSWPKSHPAWIVLDMITIVDTI